MDKKVIIIGTVPYNTSGPSRAFESYFSGIAPSCLAQIFSNSAIPKKGHCHTLYQITDVMMLRRLVNPKKKVGRIYNIEELSPMDSNSGQVRNDLNVVEKRLHTFGAAHSPAAHILRKILWKKKNWCTNELNKWLDDFQPECVFISFSDEFFILDIALYVSERYNIPIVFTISDDYFFNDRMSFSPLYHYYRNKYKAAVKKLLARCKYGVYICDKIKEKYNDYFGLSGETVYLTSTLSRKEFAAIPTSCPTIRYFGNVMLDRYLSLIEIGNALQRINKDYHLEVYASGMPEGAMQALKSCEGIVLQQPIPYSEVCQKTQESDLLIAAEGFTDHNIRSTKYSLSTKAADSLASGVNVFAYGSLECGLINYLKKNDACMVCHNQNELLNDLERLIFDEELQRYYYQQARKTYDANHLLKVSTQRTQKMIEMAISEW